MTLGPIGLHGGGELVPGDEPFLRALLEAAGGPARTRTASRVPGSVEKSEADHRRIVILPTAAAGERPELAVAHARDAFGRIGVELGVSTRVVGAMVLDARSAGDPRWAAAIAGADLIYLPGGDPGLVAGVLRGTLAAGAMLAARARGATVAGASAGAMALAGWTWTRSGGTAGLGFVPGLVVVPHAGRFAGTDLGGARAWLGDGLPDGTGLLALDERTGVLSTAGSAPSRAWRVAGAGRATWLPAGTSEPVVARDGDDLVLDA